MASRKYHLILFILIFSRCLGKPEHSKQPLWQEEQKAGKLVASEDALEFQKRLGFRSMDYGEKWIVMPDGNGNAMFSLMDVKNDGSKSGTRMLNTANLSEKIKFILYTPNNPDGFEFDLKSLDDFKLNKSNPIRIICHGWMADSSSSIVQSIRDAYLAHGTDNVIAVDWKPLSHDLFYPLAAKNTYPVGKYVGVLIEELVRRHEVDYKDFHLIGHSLGAHVAGFAGNSVQEKVGRITGLDPALPGFQYVADKSGRLDDSDAAFVDVIHTCSGLLGISIPVGHVDFYPNGGSPFQPGCSNNTILPTTIQACSHSRSHEFFSESVSGESEFKAVKCQDWDHFKSHDCEDEYAIMGEHVGRNVRGIFYLKTNNESPFGMGMNGTVF